MFEKRLNQKYSTKYSIFNIQYSIFCFLIVFSLLITVNFVNAQDLTTDQAFGGDTGQTAEELAQTSGLATSDPRLIIARVINIILGFLGIIAVGIVIYGGWLWMTAAGNMEQITRAKQVLTAGAIGLVIILSAFGIATFVMRVLVGSTDGNTPNGSSGNIGPGGGPSPDQFSLINTSPDDGDTEVIRNVKIRYFFNSAVSGASVDSDNFKVEQFQIDDNGNRNSVAINGERTVNGKRVEFLPDEACPAPNENRKCLPEFATVKVTATSGIVRIGDGAALECRLVPCIIEFETSDIVDTQSPNVNLNNPGQVCAGSSVDLSAEASDDSHVSYVDFFADNQQIGDSIGNQNKEDPFTAIQTWNTADYIENTKIRLSAIAHDADANSANDSLNITLRPGQCCNGDQDDNETGIDCGGPCAACPGSSCRDNNLDQCSDNNNTCASGLCNTEGDDCICRDVPVISAITPKGGFCEADSNISCQSNDDCDKLSSDDCNTGASNGAPGNIISIIGRGFGKYQEGESRVLFTYTRGPDLNEVEAPLANSVNSACTNFWSSNLIMAIVPDTPDGFVFEKITVVNQDGFKGEYEEDFVINNIQRPGLCKVDPTEAEFEGLVTLQGINFGASGDAGNVLFGNAASGGVGSWTDKTITGAKVPNLASGRTTVELVKDTRSNALPFTVKNSSRAPIIYSFSPNSGGEGTYVTVFGDNFGDSMGSGYLKFGTADGDFSSFPTECGLNDVWSDNQIIVKVPKDLDQNSYSIEVKNDLGFTITSSENFTVNNSTTPGLCKISPDNGPTNTSVTFFGENFGDDQGSVNFYNNQNATVDSWEEGSRRTADQAIAEVPQGASSGPVKVLNSASAASNEMNFRVGSCLDAGAAGDNNPTCDTGSFCCGANTQLPGSCAVDSDACGYVASSGYSQYYFEFSTAVSSRSDDGTNVPPRVIEECDRQNNQCDDSATPSPSPWTPRWDENLNRPLACVDSIIAARFTTLINTSTLNNNNIQVSQCSADEEDQEAACDASSNPVAGEITPFNNTTDNQGGFEFNPASDLAPNSWHVVVLKGGTGGIASEPEVSMTEDYIWYFRTREDGTSCKLGCVGVSPLNYTSRHSGEFISYSANADSEDNACNLIDVSGHNFSWTSSNENKATVSYDEESINGGATNDSFTYTALAETKAETGPDNPVKITATETINGKVGRGDLRIIFPDFKVIEEWPTNQCATVCLNADVGAKFSAWIKPQSVQSDHAKLYKCENKECKDDELTATIATIDLKRDTTDNARLNFNLSGALLEANTWYRAVIHGGASGILSRENKQISGTNYNDNNILSYSWTFKTGFRSCQVDEVELNPDPGVATLVGQKINYSATPMSNDTSCSAEGQILRRADYQWGWSPLESDSPQDLVGYIKDDDLAVSRAEQKVTAIGNGEVTRLGNSAIQQTTIKATVPVNQPDQPSPVDGTAYFNLMCGYVSDNNCKEIDGNGALQDRHTTYGVGSNSCCYPRPQVASSQPEIGAINVCRNALITATFNEGMDISSFNGNVVVAADYGNSTCPAGTNYLRFAQNGSNGKFQQIAYNIFLSFKQWFNKSIVFAPVRWSFNQVAKIPFIDNILKTKAAWAVGGRWCAIEGQTSGSNITDASGNIHGQLEFNLRQLLPAGKNHVLLIQGDSNLTDNIHEGVLNRMGVSMGEGGGVTMCNSVNDPCTFNGSSFYGAKINFTTLSETAPNNGVCVADHVQVTPASWLFRTNQNDVRDDKQADALYDSIEDNDKEFVSVVRSATGQALASISAVYSWTWNWASGNASVAAVNTSDNNKQIVRTEYTGNRAVFTDISATANITSTIAGVSSENKSGSALVHVFICNNPWPNYNAGSPWPFRDSGNNCSDGTCLNTNFEFFYCRDKGQSGGFDDLPALNSGAVFPIQSNPTILKEFLFTFDNRPEVVQNLIAISLAFDVNGNGLFDLSDVEGLFNILTNDLGATIESSNAINAIAEDSLINSGDNNFKDYEKYDYNFDNKIGNQDLNLLFSAFQSGGANVSDNSVTLKWSKVDNVDHYNVYYKKQGTSSFDTQRLEQSECNNSGVCSKVISNLINNIKYDFKITSVKEITGGLGGTQYEESGYSNVATAIPMRSTSLAGPTGLSASIDSRVVSLSWTKSTDADVTGYKVYIGYGDARANDEYRSVGNVDNYKWTVSDPKATYYFRVQSVGDGEGGFSGVVSVEK